MKFSTLSQYFSTLEQTSSRLVMTRLLAELFHQVSEDEIGPICYLLEGRVAPLFEPVEFGIADQFMIRAIARATDTPISAVKEAFSKTGDLGTAAQLLAGRGVPDAQGAAYEQTALLTTEKAKLATMDSSVLEVFDVLSTIAHTQGVGSQEKKVELLAGLLAGIDPGSVRFVVRIPLGKLRLGFSDMTILDGLSWMLGGDKSKREVLENGWSVRSDLGYIARVVKREGIAGIETIQPSPGTPIVPALCQRIGTTEEMITKMGEVDAEPKFDGVRTQIHFIRGKGKNSDMITSFSRNLENTTAMYPELMKLGSYLDGKSVILDTEAVGYDEKTGNFVPFQETVTRKRKHDIASASQGIPLKFFVFDILVKNGVSLLDEPLSARRKILRNTLQEGGPFSMTDHIVTSDPDVLRAYHKTQREKGLEGIVVKQWNSTYEPGRKGFRWVKLKEEEGKSGKLTDTIDCVIMGYSRGEGKRSGFGIGQFLVGILDGGIFTTISKIGTGVSDDLWQTLESRLSKLKVTKKPKEYAQTDKLLVPDYWIVPSVVVEIAADDLTVSPVHGAGYALRFPRLVRMREDKSPNEATTKEEVLRMYSQQNVRM